MSNRERAVEMAGSGKRGKPKAGFPSASPSPWKSLRDSHIPTAGHDCLFSKSNPKKGTPQPVPSLPLPGSFFNEKMLCPTKHFYIKEIAGEE
jgi:hypothetical protein